MSTTQSPAETFEDWSSVREEWIEAVDQLFSRVEACSLSRGWTARREPEVMQERGLGTYQTWRLTLEAPEGKILFRPFARRVCDASGVIDLLAQDSDGEMTLVRHKDGIWNFHPFGNNEPATPWSESEFFEVTKRLFASAGRNGA